MNAALARSVFRRNCIHLKKVVLASGVLLSITVLV